MRKRSNRRAPAKATADLTPMIDVTFQLLIFFILCTRFREPEKHHKVELPKDQGSGHIGVPKESLTLYCNWDEAYLEGRYVLAMGARNRRAVDGSHAALHDLVIFPRDTPVVVQAKRDVYSRVHGNLVDAILQYQHDSGGILETIEISFATRADVGARSGTAPWMFVSLALDAAAEVNAQRAEAGLDALPVNFKFADSLERFSD
jgi:biopolymer transport protein ExbD